MFSHSFLHGNMARISLDVLDMAKELINFIPWGPGLLVSLRPPTCLGLLRVFVRVCVRACVFVCVCLCVCVYKLYMFLCVGILL